MKKIIALCASAVAVAAFAAPASAAVKSGGRIEAVTGYDNVRIDLGTGANANASGVMFGLGAGYDFAVGEKVALGLDIEAADSTTDFDISTTDRVSAGRDLYAGARLTAGISDRANIYFKAGYTNARIKVESGGVSDAANGDGIRGGVGLSFDLGTNAYVSGEYRYSNYEGGFTRHQGVLAVGFRF
jgi:outer membrane immunogenic protein